MLNAMIINKNESFSIISGFFWDQVPEHGDHDWKEIMLLLHTFEFSIIIFNMMKLLWLKGCIEA